MSGFNLVSLLQHLARAEAEPAVAVVQWLGEQRGVTAAALLAAAPPDWSPLAAVPRREAPWPYDLATEVTDRGQFRRSGDWLAVPIQSNRTAPPRVIVMRGPAQEDTTLGQWLPAAQALADQLSERASRQQRAETLLQITTDWRTTANLVTLLEQMATAAARLFAADRATIFLWDQAGKTLVGRPALGLPNNELRIPDHVGIVGRVVASGKAERVNVDDDHRPIHVAVDQQTGYRTESLLCVPLRGAEGELLGAFELINKRDGRFTDDDEQGLSEFAQHASVALADTQEWERVLLQNRQLVGEASAIDFIGNCPAVVALRTTIRNIANTDLSVLLLGENGTGKEVVARALHFASRRAAAPFLAVNCAALAETLLESELFGHEKGAFTDAQSMRIGKFEAAHGGTLLLDEMGDMSLAAQAKLLRVLEERLIVRVGGNTSIPVDVRVLAATNRNLVQMVRDKKFREDLYYRLNVVSLELPPLRDRGDDILLLAEHYLQQFCRRQGRKPPKLTAAARKRLLAHRWPGNVRELRNLMERLAYLVTADRIDADDLSFILSPGKPSDDWFASGEPLTEATHHFQVAYIERTLARTRGNATEAAKLLGLHRSNLYRKMKQLGMATEEDAE